MFSLRYAKPLKLSALSSLGVGTAELPRASLIPQAFYDFMSDDEEIGARRSGGPKLSVLSTELLTKRCGEYAELLDSEETFEVR